MDDSNVLKRSGLTFVVVGSGIGGLSASLSLARAGHSVTVLEAMEELTDTGAGIQLFPNATRVLRRLGLEDFLREYGVQPQAIVFRRYATGDVIGSHDATNIESECGAAVYNVHRGQLVRRLYDAALETGRVAVRFNCRVESVDCQDGSRPSVTLSDGQRIQGDLIIGADGIHSIVRKYVTGVNDEPQDTGDAAYRAIIPAEDMISDPDLEPFISKPSVTCWLGPGKHIVGYCISGKAGYNIVLAFSDKDSIESWTLEGSADRMRAEFLGWDPKIQKILKLVRSTYKWKLMDRSPLETWVHPSSRLLLTGDACHPMLPYRAQGAAMAIEDAEVLGEIFSQVGSEESIKELAFAFQEIRSSRCAEAQKSSRMNQMVFHFPDGPAQQARDERLRQSVATEHDRNTLLYYDVLNDVERWRGRRDEK